MESHEIDFDGEKVTLLVISKEEGNLIRENNCNSATLLENGTACDYDPVGARINFGEITPEDITADGGGNRDWSKRSDREKPVWHLHVSFAGEPGVICTEVHGDTDDEAGNAAIDAALAHLQWEKIWGEDKVYGWEQNLWSEGYCMHLYTLGKYCSPDGCPGVIVEAT